MTAVVTNLLLNTGGMATQAWMFTAVSDGVQILNSDYDTDTPGVQVISTSGGITLTLKAPLGGTVGHVSLASATGDAYGTVAINLIDDGVPNAPSGLSVTAGQSRIWVSWRTNSEPDVTGYRVYYRAEVAGPPWDGVAAIEGARSPVSIAGTNCLLRGLSLASNYFVTVSAVDSTGNESPLAPAVFSTTTQAPPAPPTALAWRAGTDGTNVLMWALSEDDGYNDRDVVRYDIYRVVTPGGESNKVVEVGAGLGIYSETNTPVGFAQYLAYALVAVDSSGLSSTVTTANRVMATGVGIDNDGDGIPDSWMNQYFGHPTGSAPDKSLAQDDPDSDELTNLQEYQLGLNPIVPDRPWLQALGGAPNGGFTFSVGGSYGRNATLQFSTNLVGWEALGSMSQLTTNGVVEDVSATNSSQRFYRIIVP